MTIKKLQAPDFDITMNLIHQYRDEAIESMDIIEDQYDENSVIQSLRDYATQHNHCCLLLLEGQRPVGFIAGYIVESPWNRKNLYGHIRFVYILPSHRNFDNFRELITAFENWGKEHFGIVGMSGGDIGINRDRMKKIYEHFGFREILHMIKDFE